MAEGAEGASGLLLGAGAGEPLGGGLAIGVSGTAGGLSDAEPGIEPGGLCDGLGFLCAIVGGLSDDDPGVESGGLSDTMEGKSGSYDCQGGGTSDDEPGIQFDGDSDDANRDHIEPRGRGRMSSPYIPMKAPSSSKSRP